MKSWVPRTLCIFKVKYLTHKKSFFFLIDFCMCVCVCTKHIVTLSWWGEWWRCFISDGEALWVIENFHGWWRSSVMMEKLHGWCRSPQMNSLKHNTHLSIIHETWEKGYLSEPSYSLPSISTLNKMSERICFNVLLLKLGHFLWKSRNFVNPHPASTIISIMPISFYLCPHLLFHR